MELEPSVYSCKSHSESDYLSLLFTAWHMLIKSEQIRLLKYFFIALSISTSSFVLVL